MACKTRGLRVERWNGSTSVFSAAHERDANFGANAIQQGASERDKEVRVKEDKSTPPIRYQNLRLIAAFIRVSNSMLSLV